MTEGPGSTDEEIIRRAEGMGLSTERVARALNYVPDRPDARAEPQATLRLKRPSLRARLFGRRADARRRVT
jgi:hypothetical protein